MASTIDYRILRTDELIIRWDTKTGATEALASQGGSSGVVYSWNKILDIKDTPAPADEGRYMIVSGLPTSGKLIRMDMKTGRTWAAVTTGLLNWQEVAK